MSKQQDKPSQDEISSAIETVREVVVENADLLKASLGEKKYTKLTDAIDEINYSVQGQKTTYKDTDGRPLPADGKSSNRENESDAELQKKAEQMTKIMDSVEKALDVDAQKENNAIKKIANLVKASKNLIKAKMQLAITPKHDSYDKKIDNQHANDVLDKSSKANIQIPSEMSHGFNYTKRENQLKVAKLQFASAKFAATGKNEEKIQEFKNAKETTSSKFKEPRKNLNQNRGSGRG